MPCSALFPCLDFYLTLLRRYFSIFFFFNDTATTEIYTLSLHDALPILNISSNTLFNFSTAPFPLSFTRPRVVRSEEHTSELQSPCNLVCRLLLEKKKTRKTKPEEFYNADRIHTAHFKPWSRNIYMSSAV